MKQIDKADFLIVHDALSITINNKANELFNTLQNFDATKLNLEDRFKNYFIHHHLQKRLFFSIQNSAFIIYHAVKKTGRPINELNFIDYGAGLGTLFMLGGMLGFKRCIYNDYLPDWKNAARSICEAMEIPVTDYITGDIDEVLNYADSKEFKFDIIASRNVIEHVYSLSRFYTLIREHNINTITFSTTAATYHNPAMHLLFYSIHKKLEKKTYYPQRKEAIKKLWPSITEKQLIDLTKKTRGKAMEDFYKAIEQYREHKNIEPVPFLRTNSCDCFTGYWCEHLLKKNEYEYFVTQSGFKMEFTCGFWDTHYNSTLLNILTCFFNRVIVLLGKKGYLLSPFVNIIAYN
jgi:2-polyprenyl-3-methyl-5-hydroxy-6-metoxy-1,4-benzoquinol methylase